MSGRLGSRHVPVLIEGGAAWSPHPGPPQPAARVRAYGAGCAALARPGVPGP
jgi:hypothetical protein